MNIKNMAIKAFVSSITNIGNAELISCDFIDSTTNNFVTTVGFVLTFGVDIISYTLSEFQTNLQGKILTYSSSQGYGMISSDIIWTLPNLVEPPVYLNPTRTLNSSFQISSTQEAQVSYSVDISTSVSLTGGAAGTVFLEYADNTGFTTNVVEVQRFSSSNTGTLVVGLTLNQVGTACLSGVIPAGKYVRLRTSNTTGTPTYTFRSSQEVL